MPAFFFVGGRNGSRYRFEGGNSFGTGVDHSKLLEKANYHLPGIPFDIWDEWLDSGTRYVREFMVPKGTSRSQKWKRFKEAVEAL